MHMIVDVYASLQLDFIRLLLEYAVAYEFDIWTSDMTESYLKSTMQLFRDVCLLVCVPKPALDFNITSSDDETTQAAVLRLQNR